MTAPRRDVLVAVLVVAVLWVPLSFLGRAAGPATVPGRGAGLLVLTGCALLFVGAAWALIARRDS